MTPPTGNTPGTSPRATIGSEDKTMDWNMASISTTFRRPVPTPTITWKKMRCRSSWPLTPISHHLVCDKVGIRGERGAGGNRLSATRRGLDRVTMGFEPVRQHERRRVPRPQNPNSRLGPRPLGPWWPSCLSWDNSADGKSPPWPLWRRWPATADVSADGGAGSSAAAHACARRCIWRRDPRFAATPTWPPSGRACWQRASPSRSR